MVVGGRGRRRVGRFLRPCCLSILEDGSLAVAESDGVLTRFTEHLEPLTRTQLRGVEGLAGLVHAGDATQLVLISRRPGSDLVLSLGPGVFDTLRPGLLWLDPGQDTTSQDALPSPGVLVRVRDGGIVVGSSTRPAMAHLTDEGRLVWSVDLPMPELPDLLPSSAPEDLRNADFRVSSVTPLPDGTLVVSLFRPGRPHTVVAVVGEMGQMLDQLVVPFPLWFLGVARDKYLVVARIRASSEIATYLLP